MDVNAKDWYGDAPLHCELKNPNCNWETVWKLINLGADINAAGRLKKRPLHIITERSDCDSVALDRLFELPKLNVNAKDVYGDTPLHSALYNKSCPLDIVRKLINRGADINATSEWKMSPLHLLLRRTDCNLAILQELLDSATVNVNARNIYGDTPLHSALYNENCSLGIVRKLIDHGANINATGRWKMSPIHVLLSITNCNLAIFQELLDSVNVNVNARDIIGNTPLCYALRNETCPLYTVRKLIDRGADIVATGKLKNSPLHTFLKRTDCSLAMFQELLDSITVNVNARNKYGDTPLHYALNNETCSLDIVHKLIDCGADINAKGRWNMKPLHVVLKRTDCNLAILQELLDSANVNARDHFRDTPLHYALYNNSCPLMWDIVHKLIDRGADINAKGRWGRKPLHVILKRTDCDSTILQELLDTAEVNVNASDVYGDTPLNALNNKNYPWDNIVGKLIGGWWSKRQCNRQTKYKPITWNIENN